MAVDDVSFEVRPGEVLGLVGPNGAGKTSLIRMLMDIIAPDSGEILLDGRPIGRDERDQIGYLPEERGLYRKQKVIDALVYFGRLKGLDGRTAKKRAMHWLERFDLGDHAGRRVDELSKGMQQKAQIAGALLHEPTIIVMDEPFSGLDPVNTVLVKDLLLEESRAGRMVILSSHQMPMVEAMCDRVAMINRGRLVLFGDLDRIRLEHSEAAVLVDADGDLAGLPVVAKVEQDGALRRVFLKPGSAPRDLMNLLVEKRVPLEHFEVVRMPLEEIFVRIVQEGEAAV